MFVIAFNIFLSLKMVVVLFLFLVHFLQEVRCPSSTTVSQKERIKFLRHELKQEIRNVVGDTLHEDSTQEELDYVQSQKLPITPIMDIERHNEKKLHTLKTTTVKIDASVTTGTNVNVNLENKVESANNYTYQLHDTQNTSSLRSKNGPKIRKIKKKRHRKPLEIFYRRFYNKDLINEPLEWIHCQDMVTPLLTGVKTDMTHPKRLTTKDTTVQRFLQLIKVNTSSYGREDIYSILYQISNLQLRLFQWEVVPLNMLLNAIIKEHRHTFGYLRIGIRELFHSWRMDITNITNLLKQTRIFRPPCIEVSALEGSTKSPKGTKYTKKVETTTCDEDDDCID